MFCIYGYYYISLVLLPTSCPPAIILSRGRLCGAAPIRVQSYEFYFVCLLNNRYFIALWPDFYVMKTIFSFSAIDFVGLQ